MASLPWIFRASGRSILLQIFYRLDQLECRMTDIADALTALTTAVDQIGVEFAAFAEGLPQAIADRDAAFAARDAALAADATDKATIDALTATAAAADTALQDVVTGITTQTARLNALGTPVVTPPDSV